jgi:predicted thioesterase
MLMEVGISAISETVVHDSDTALYIGSGSLNVFATPMLIALMENAAIKCVDGYLDNSLTTVGTAINMEHIKASLTGEKIVARATLTAINGRELLFDVEACGDNGLTGKGIHKRFIVETEKFMNKLKEKEQKNIN